MSEFSWNKDLAKQRGAHMGAEFRRKGVNLLLGPVVGPLGRVAEGGRNWEGFTDDPYLAGGLVYETVQGIQSAGVGASTKVRFSLLRHRSDTSSQSSALYRKRARDKP